MREIIYVSDPEDRVGMRCNKGGNDLNITCTRHRDHSSNTKVSVKLPDDPKSDKVQTADIVFNHRGQKNGRWYTW